MKHRCFLLELVQKARFNTMTSQKTSYRLMNGRTVAGTSHTYHALCVYSGKSYNSLTTISETLPFVIPYTYVSQPYYFHPFPLTQLTTLPISPLFCALCLGCALTTLQYPIAFTNLLLHTHHLTFHAPPAAGSSASNPCSPPKLQIQHRSLCLVSSIKGVRN